MIDSSGPATWDSGRLIGATLAGHSDAFSELMRRARPEILGVLRRHAWGAPDVEALYQEVIVRAFRSLPHLRRAESFRPWLLQITYCASVDWIRRECLLRQTQQPLLHELPDAFAPYGQDGADEECCLPLLVEEIARLKPRHAAALLLRGLEGMTYREIAAELECSISCVKTYLHRARRRLRSRMARAAAESGTATARTAPLLDPGKDKVP